MFYQAQVPFQSFFPDNNSDCKLQLTCCKHIAQHSVIEVQTIGPGTPYKNEMFQIF